MRAGVVRAGRADVAPGPGGLSSAFASDFMVAVGSLVLPTLAGATSRTPGRRVLDWAFGPTALAAVFLREAIFFSGFICLFWRANVAELTAGSLRRSKASAQRETGGVRKAAYSDAQDDRSQGVVDGFRLYAEN